MKEILFRGKRKDNGEWTEGYFFKSWNRVFLLWGMTGDSPNMVEVIPETVGQFTGLVDKNGTNIFEGDIVRYGKGIYEWNKKYWKFEIGIIEFKDGAFIINDIYSIDGYNELSCLYHEINCSDKYDSGTLFEIIGNIHDNPELLGE